MSRINWKGISIAILFAIILAVILQFAENIYYGALFVFGAIDIAKASFFWNIVLAIGTLALATSAIFQDRIRAWVWKPKLNLEMHIWTPDCQKVPVKVTYTRSNSFTKEKFTETDFTEAYYIRLKVYNHGDISAEKVQVFISHLNKKDKSGKFKYTYVKEFSQQNLIWNTFGEGLVIKYIWDYIPPKTFQYINLGVIYKPNELRDKAINESFTINNLNKFGKDANKETFFSIQQYAKSYNQEHLLIKDEYKFMLTIAASNIKKTKNSFIELKFNGEWSDDINEMLHKNLKIKFI
jgi:hypothetical protein